ncbi:MAG: CHASE domain-containing protein [Alphaproteobacteria bacterium]|nr:CHASE domain-containing protein [Alphaproteobacteria bacterium]
MSSSVRQHQYGAIDFLPIVAVAIIGLAAAVIVFTLARGYYLAADRDAFQRDAADYGAAFKTGIERHVNSLAAIHAFVSSSHDVNRWEFSNFAHQILPQNSGFKAVLWLPHVAGKQRKAFEAGLQNDGLYGLRLREVAADGTLVPAGDRDRYIPVAYVEPFDASGGLIGVDLAKDPIYAPLFQRARDSGKVVASPPLQRALVDGARAPLMLVVFPLGRETVLEKAARQRIDTQKPAGLKSGTQSVGAPPDLEGYALGVLQLTKVVEGIVGAHAPVDAAIATGSGASLNVYPAGTPGEPAAPAMALTRWFGDSEFHQIRPFAVAGTPFYLALRSNGTGSVLTRLYVPAGASLLVLALAALLAQTMLSITMRKRQVERAVIARTAELSKTNRALAAEIEQRRDAEGALRIAKDKAEAANRAKSAFLSTMSHELRTPLNAVIGFSGMLIDQPDASRERTQDYLGEINSSGARLLDLINDILEITQMDTETRKTDELVYLPDIAEAVIAKMRPQAAMTGVSLHNAVTDNVPMLRGDSRRLQKALANLVSNAVKFTPKGGEAILSAVPGPDGLAIEVRDNGMGMLPGEAAKVVDLFSQGDNTLSRRHDGVGLGLTFVRRVADQHDARLQISSAPGQGTVIRMILPAARIVPAREVA